MTFQRPSRFFLILVLVAISQLGFFGFKVDILGHPEPIQLENITLISRGVYLIQHEYYDSARIRPREMLEEGFYELAKEIPDVLPQFQDGSLKLFVGNKNTDIGLAGVDKLYDILAPVSAAFAFLREHHTGQITPAEAEYAFIRGMLSVLDPHSNILPPKEYEEFKTQTQGEYGGLGIVIGIKDQELTIVSPIEDTPAFRAGLKADDKILMIDDQNTTNMPLTDAVDLMRGIPGTQVTLKVKSKNRQPRDVTLMREKIVIESVVSKLVTKDRGRYGVIRIKGFQEDTREDAVQAVKALKRESGGALKGIVLDLRNNPGGLLDQAILVADMFLRKGDIVFTVGAGNLEEEVAVAKEQSDDVDLPMIVLINEGSASASEIVAGALKNNDRAVVIGKKSFGKGSVQSLFSLRDGSSLKLTVAQYLTPGRQSIQAVGIAPDIHVYPSVIAPEFYDLVEDDILGEEKLEAHLDNAAQARQNKPLHTLSYLEEEKDEAESSYTNKIKDDDFVLNLAIDILARTNPAQPRTAILSNVHDVLKKEVLEQDKKITVALQKKDIDWSLCDSPRKSSLKVQHEFLNENGAPVSLLKAETKASLRITLTNAGAHTVCRALAEIEAFNPLLDHQEFVFGRVSPGAQKTAEIPLDIPADIIPFHEKIKLNTYTQARKETPHSISIATQFVDQSPPHLAYAYQVADGTLEGTVGNKNGIPEKGEEVFLQVKIKNVGPVAAKKTIINIKNTEGKYVLLKKARDSLEDLVPGGVDSRSLSFAIRKDFEKSDLAIDFFVFDDATKAGISDQLKFHLTNPQKADPPPDEFQTAPQITISDQTRQIKDKLVLQGEASDGRQLKDISIFVKGRKLVYINLENEPEGARSKTFHAELPLTKGINAVVIQARSMREVKAQKTLSYVYTPDDGLMSASTE